MLLKIDGSRSEKEWESSDGKVKIWSITEENGTTHKTMSEKIAAGGEFDAEIYTNSKGKQYVRQIQKDKPQFKGGGDKQFKADPDSRESIEWQKAYALAVETARDYFVFRSDAIPESIEDYAKEIDKVAVHYKNIINLKPEAVTTTAEPEDEVEDQGDFAKINPVEDLPPVEAYEGMG